MGEALVNALAHRDYHSNASVEVRLFTDRQEIWNPGTLPGTLTLASLREDHPSVPNNPLLVESLYLARYIERVGPGTQKMIQLCRHAGLPEPDFEQRHGFFVTTLWRDWVTTRVLANLDRNDRQRGALGWLKQHQTLTNSLYQSELGASKRTASRELDEW